MNTTTIIPSQSLPRHWKLALSITLMALHLGVFAMACAQENSRQFGLPGEQLTVLDSDTADNGLRFEAIDVFVDSGNEGLAAYQFELDSTSEGVEIVGIEGGEHAAFAEPPYYDPQAMNGNRVVLAAFSTGRNLPKGRSRVARIHVQLQGAEPKTYRTTLSVSANADGEPVSAELKIAKAKA